MTEQHIFIELSIIFVIVALVSALMRYFRQPLILGYILTGILVGPLALDIIKADATFAAFSEIGIALLLFIIGLGMNIGVIKSLGKVSIVVASAILLPMLVLGYLVGVLSGLDTTSSLIVALSLFFSSTIIIIKALSDKKELNRLHGQIAIGVIIVDDIIATLAIVVLSAMGQGGTLSVQDIALLVLKALGLGLLLYVAGAKVVPLFAKRFAKNQEYLFVFAIAWAFGIASLFDKFGFSPEVGALFAGVSLASIPYATEMAARLKPLRDFFVILFFVYLGERFIFDNFGQVLIPAILLSTVVIVGKPLFVMASLGLLKYTKLTSFKVGIHLSQISEFSIVLLVIATGYGIVSQHTTSIITLVALVTIGVSSYLMKYDDEIYRKLEKFLSVFERKNAHEKTKHHTTYTSILFGYHHGGHEFLELFRDMKQFYLVVDHNPEVVEHLESQGIRHAYGDATDYEFLEEINAGHAKFAASTVLDSTVNKQILAFLRRFTTKTIFICHAQTYEEALDLYEHGASYVILPRFFGGEHITKHIKKNGLNIDALKKFRQKHILNLGRYAVET
ncbi:cation:proton antiporter [Candidatus Saccharibacteria bacterium]|nr:cation:proton antiporter [Candidatus Saccharibacteria bacterium]